MCWRTPASAAPSFFPWVFCFSCVICEDVQRMALNETELGTLYREHVPLLYGYVSLRTAGSRSLSEDIVLETFLRAVHHWRADGVPPVSQVWLRRVAHNLLMSHFRRRRPVSLEEYGFDPKSDFHVELPSEAALVNWGLSRLRVEQVELIEAFHFEKKSIEVIATELKIFARAAEGRLYRARRALRDLLRPLRETSEARHDRPAPTRS